MNSLLPINIWPIFPLPRKGSLLTFVLFTVFYVLHREITIHQLQQLQAEREFHATRDRGRVVH